MDLGSFHSAGIRVQHSFEEDMVGVFRLVRFRFSRNRKEDQAVTGGPVAETRKKIRHSVTFVLF